MECGVLELVRESSGLLCSSLLPVLLLITFILIFPFSAISLSQSIVSSHLAGQLSALCSHALSIAAGARASPLARLFYLQLSQALLSQAACLPIALTLCMLAKAAVFYLLACRDRAKEASLVGFLEAGPQACCRMAATHLWGCLCVALVTAAVVLLHAAAAMALAVLSGSPMAVGGIHSSLLAVFEIGAICLYAGMLAPMVVIFNLSTLVAGMEEAKWGPHASLRALMLLRHRRLQPALLLFLITGISIVGVEGVFQYRVLGRAASPAPPPASGLLEAPFLIFAHSFLLLFDIILSVVFYHACQYEVELSYCVCSGKLKCEEDEDDDDHFSIVIHIAERQCRKLLTASQTIL